MKVPLTGPLSRRGSTIVTAGMSSLQLLLFDMVILMKCGIIKKPFRLTGLIYSQTKRNYVVINVMQAA